MSDSCPGSVSSGAAALPVLDLRELEIPERRAAFLAELGRAAREIGFFYLIGHGVPAEKFVRIEEVSRRFFALPDEEKLAIGMANSPHFRGYTATGHELTRNRPDRREQIDIGVELPALELGPGDPVWKRLQGPNQWPAGLPALREVALDWSATLRQVAIRLLRAFAQALEQPADALDGLIDKTPAQLLKLIRYPGSSDPALRQGVGAHKDAGILTLLHQDHHGGLQVERPEGWIDVPPIEGAFVINIGEILELATNGYLRATMHRVVTPPEGVVRYSIGYFLSPSLEGSVPLLPLPEHLAKLALGPESDPENPLFREIGPNAIKGRLRSHRDVAERHYPEQYAALDRFDRR
ncbi:isopenicillin N synthase family dioxygenase [Halotalea alkalilenta]|uniref:isopenicillin N synthase family dioxygenase n=1 Tax=Halotalea alkalilenta TaxID=376489 RepID=UPI000A5CD08E|nr:2-oxoglutarate and iron-dependent oxygenase domain-containing protein [Halotalea alkalilenta]